MDNTAPIPKKMTFHKQADWFVEAVKEDPEMSTVFVALPWCGHKQLIYIVDKEERIHGRESSILLVCEQCELGAMAKTRYCRYCETFFCVTGRPHLCCI